jgi:hypothetical protein
MQNVNWWLMALAFLLGLVLTLFLLIRRVKREVPEYAALGAGAGVAAAGAAGAAGAARRKGGDKLTGSAGFVEDKPYGAGSIRVEGTATAPDGDYTVKGNEDSMLYHTSDSPSWKQTIAEVWFRDVKSAEQAGFARWDSGGRADADAETATAETGGVAAGAAAAGAAVAGGAAAAKFAGSGDVEEPYGAGSARVAAGAQAPAGYDIKGNEDSMLYHTPDSPSYKRTIAEVWFRDVPTAEAAGFHRWDSGRSQRPEA